MRTLTILAVIFGGGFLYAMDSMSSSPKPVDECVCKTITGGTLLDTDCYKIVMAETEVICEGDVPVSVNLGGVTVERVGTGSGCKEIGSIDIYSGEDKDCSGGLDGDGDMKDGMLNTMSGGEETMDFSTPVNGDMGMAGLGSVSTGSGTESVKVIAYLSVKDTEGMDIFNKKIERTATN
ncbi:MAG: hypothetical protein AAF196_19945 [Planctomycetota bacterium]